MYWDVEVKQLELSLLSLDWLLREVERYDGKQSKILLVSHSKTLLMRYVQRTELLQLSPTKIKQRNTMQSGWILTPADNLLKLLR
jgi:hypothetical protein